MAVQTYADSPYLFTMSVNATGAAVTELQGLSEFSVDWQRPLRFVKDLDDNAPYITYGKSQGAITLQGKAISASVASSMASSHSVFDGVNPNPDTSVAITVACKKGKTAATTTVVYNGYATGKGFTFRQITDRYWILDGVQRFQFID